MAEVLLYQTITGLGNLCVLSNNEQCRPTITVNQISQSHITIRTIHLWWVSFMRTYAQKIRAHWPHPVFFSCKEIGFFKSEFLLRTE